jgi:SAM-dependent methyltransferase
MLPNGARVLDVGAGDGFLGLEVQRSRPDLAVSGIDVLVRERAMIPVARFDGRTIPFDSGSFDVVMFVDVLHHTEDALVLLREASRVTRHSIVIKDHRLDGVLAGSTLALMDWIGNAGHGVALPNNYWPERRWRETFDALGLRIRDWQTELGLYPGLSDRVFGRSLHFVARLEPTMGA